MAARKPWEQLKPSYQRRLLSKGITPESHAQGAPIAAARGKKSEEEERRYSGYRRRLDRFADRMERFYGIDPDEAREQLRDHPRVQVEEGMELQALMEELYENGQLDEARRLWETRDQTLPEWMHHYHGSFSGR